MKNEEQRDIKNRRRVKKTKFNNLYARNNIKYQQNIVTLQRFSNEKLHITM